jgi:hypothetical protein
MSHLTPTDGSNRMPFNLRCSWKTALGLDLSRQERIGYLCSFRGPVELKPDITVFNITGQAPQYAGIASDRASGKIAAVAVIENFAFQGGPADPICISAYISPENAELLWSKLKDPLAMTAISACSWWIAGYDDSNKTWFEEAYPKRPTAISGQINAAGGKDPRVLLADQPTRVATIVDLSLYNLYFEVVPASNTGFDLHFATTARTLVTQNWGRVVETSVATPPAAV